MRDHMEVSEADVGRMEDLMRTTAQPNNIFFTVTKLVTEKYAIPPAPPGEPGMTPGQLLDLQLLEIALQDGTPHDLNIQIGEEMWTGIIEHFKEGLGRGDLQQAAGVISHAYIDFAPQPHAKMAKAR